MTNEELLEQVGKIIRSEIASIETGLQAIHKDMATKKDIKKLNKTIEAYLALTKVYMEQQEILSERIEEIEQFLGFYNN